MTAGDKPRPAKKKARAKQARREPAKAAATEVTASPGLGNARNKTTASVGAAPGAETVPGFPIVGIGASAGGLAALEAFFKAMPVDAGIGFVLVVHLDPTHTSILPELLQKHTRMPVCQAEDGTQVERDHVYVIPPNHDLGIMRGTLFLTGLVHPRGSNLPIDSFLRSLARDQERNAVCIILSGTGTDGTLGVKAIKGGLGMVMVQDEASAKYDGMPHSAIATGLADYVLPPAELPEQLTRYIRHAREAGGYRIKPAEEANLPALQKIFMILRARTDHDFTLYKKNTICRRIERRMNVHQIDDITDYVRYLQQSEHESAILFKDLLIGVTNFFRDPEAFEILQADVLPGLLEGKREDEAVRIWVPGCSSGEEPYSVAIAVHEAMAKLGRQFHVQIFGTDIDEDAIAVARSGVYPASIIEDVGPDRIDRHFTTEDDGQYRVNKRIREMLVFAPQNVIKDPPFTKLDLLCCRNLLIYLDSELQRKLVAIFHYSLRPNGLLFLGSSETVGSLTDLFTATHKKWKIFRRMGQMPGTRPSIEFPRQQEVYEARDLKVPETVQRAEELSALQLVETILHKSGTPPCAIVSDNCNLVYVHGRTGKFLEPAEGKASVNIVDMARPGLGRELADGIRHVAADKRQLVRRGLKVNYDGSVVYLDLTITPILEQVTMRGLMMVAFEETPPPSKRKRPAGRGEVAKSKDIGVTQLEQELLYTRESLQTTIEEMETSNEELKSTNEELQSTNEELQSTNEELETSKEELQSLNEESVTVNSELQARIDELTKTNDDIKNLLDATEVATVFLDTDLRVRRFTTSATAIVPFTPADIGRPINHLATVLRDVDLAEYGRQVLADLAVRQVEVESRDKRSYVMRVRPYRTVSNVIEGVVITFVENTEVKQQAQALRQQQAGYRTLFELVNDPIAVIDPETGVFVEFNRGACESLGYSQEEFKALRWSDIETAQSSNEIRAHLGRIIEQGGGVFETRFRTKSGEVHAVRFAARVIDIGEGQFLMGTWQHVEPGAGGA